MDQQLVERAQKGDRDAYDVLARGSADRLYAVAYQITRDPDQAHDALQQALLAMWRDLPSLRESSRFEGWSYSLVVHACLADLRRRRRAAFISLADHDVADASPDVATGIVLRDQVQRALATLTPDHRAVIVLRHLAGMPLNEIADVLGIPYGTAGSRLHHATRALRAEIEAAERTPVLGAQPS